MGSAPEFIALLEQISDAKPVESLSKLNRLVDLQLKPGDEAAARNCRAMLLYEHASSLQGQFHGKNEHNSANGLEFRYGEANSHGRHLHPGALPLYSRALDDLEEAIKRDANNITYYCNRARLKLCFRRYDSALDDVNRALEIHPGHPHALILQSDVFLCLNDEPSAMNCLSRLIRSQPSSSRFAARASRFAILGKNDNAIEDLNVAIALCRHGQGSALGYRDSDDQKLRCERCGRLYIKRACLHMMEGHTQSAKNDVNNALRSRSEYVQSRAMRLKARLMGKATESEDQSNLDEIEGLYNACIEVDRNYIHGLCERASFLMSRSKHAKALQDWQRVALLCPNDKRVKRAINFCESKCHK